MFVCLSVGCLSVFLFVCLSFCLSGCLSVCLYVGLLDTVGLSKACSTICDGDVTDGDGQLSVMFTIRVRPILVITVPMLHDYIILILHFVDGATVPNQFLLWSVNFRQSRQNRIDFIRVSTLRQAIRPS